MLKMAVENIRRAMRDGFYFENRLSEWEKTKWSTNCYAFSLGLNVPEDNICDYAYRPGNIANNVIGTYVNSANIDATAREIGEFVSNDLKALGIKYEVFKDKDEYQYLRELEHPPGCWDILFFYKYRTHDYHFVRVGRDGLLYHKMGWKCIPEVTDIKTAGRGYSLIKRYRLSLGEEFKK